MIPEAFLDRMKRMLGKEYDAFIETYGMEGHKALRLNRSKQRADGQNVAQALGVEEGITNHPEEAGVVCTEGGKAGKLRLHQVPWAENGYYFRSEDNPGKHPYHDAGLYYIQEPSAMMPAELLEVQPGERVLDLCAAPGGKSTQIAGKMQGQGILFCNEINSERAKILSENIERMGIGNACVLNETPERLAGLFPAYFDKILVDAPCSGEGMFRKNEDACNEWSPETVEMCAQRQDGILDCAAKMLRCGGRLVYSTCTFAPEENEGSVSRFLHRHSEFQIVKISGEEKKRRGLEGCEGKTEYIAHPASGLEGTIRLWPHHIQGEGHYAAVLHKKEGNYGDDASGSETIVLPKAKAASRKSKGIKGKTVNEGMEGMVGKVPEAFAAFVHETIGFAQEKEEFREPWEKANSPWKDMQELLRGIGNLTGMYGTLQMVEFGDNLYLVPAGMPSLKGIKVLRPGLHLGQLKKNRFEPSHALALALMPQGAQHRWNLSADSQRILAYLNGETFPAEGEKGWYLICVDGFGIGWGKLAGGVMKNHYPRGLRGRKHE